MRFVSLISVLPGLKLTAGHGDTLKLPRDNTIVIPSTAQNGPSDAQFAFHSEQLNALELSLVNSTAWEWWYYDVVAADQTSSFVIAFFSSPSTDFPFLPSEIGSMDVVASGVLFPMAQRLPAMLLRKK